MDIARLSYSDEHGIHVLDLDRDSTSLGRAPDLDVVLRDPVVSRRHALILREANSYTLLDQESRSGVYLNGARVKRAELKPGDVVQLGSPQGTRLHFDGQISARTLRGSTAALLTSLGQLPAPAASLAPAAQEMEKLAWLLKATKELSEGIAIEDILSALLHLSLQLTRLSRGYIFLKEDSGLRLAQGLSETGEILGEDSTISRTAIQKALKSASRFTISDTLSDNESAASPSIVANQIRSIYCIPLRGRHSKDGSASDDLLGLLYLDSQLKLGNLAEVDRQLLDKIAVDATALLHNALLAQNEILARQAREELAVAARIHSALMSTGMPALPYATLHAKSTPCLAIGGDFYDAVLLDDCVCLMIADVSGKGIPAAIVASALQGIVHSQLLSGQSLAQVADLANRFLCARNVGKYATMILLKLYPSGQVEYINCGHVQPLVISSSGMTPLEDSNLVVGLIAGASYLSARTTLRPGERVLLLTDGITEAEDEQGTQFMDAKLHELCACASVDSVLDLVASFQGSAPVQDDCTLLEVCYSGLNS